MRRSGSRYRFGFSVVALAAAFFVTGHATPAAAGVRTAADVGYSFGASDFGDNTDPALAFGGAVHYELRAPRLSFGAAVSRRSYDSVREIREPFAFSMALTTLHASVQYAFLDAASGMAPFVGVEGGWAVFDYDWSKVSLTGSRDTGSLSDGGLSLSPLVGFRIGVADHIRIEATARYEYVATGSINYGDRFTGDAITSFAMRIGAAVAF